MASSRSTVFERARALDATAAVPQPTFTPLTGGDVHDSPHRAKELVHMTAQIDRIEGRVVRVDAFVVVCRLNSDLS